MVGASVPAQLHDTVLGPAVAYKNLANAAEEGQKGRTRFFQGGGMGSGGQSQMAGGQDSKIITNFEDLAQKIDYLLGEKVDLENIGMNNHSTFESSHSIRKAEDILINIIKQQALLS